jgi:polar amino acid transport system substrate-binding protein
MSVSARRLRAVVLSVAAVTAAVTAAATLAACGSSSGAGTTTTTPASAGGSTGATGSADPCAKDALKLVKDGTLTVGTDKPAYAPWFVDDTPSNGNGFESAVAYAVADKLGFSKDQVSWITASFDSAIQAGPKDFDFDINQVSITDDRKKNIDFSSGYYDVAQAIITTKGSKIANAKSVADLKGAKLAAQTGTTSYKVITDIIKPTQKPGVYNTNDDAKLELANGQVDGLVLDLPTALYEASGADDQLKDGALIGQFENAGGTPEQFGLVLDKGSALTSCVTKAVDALRADGTLKKLEAQWLTSTAGAPVIK